VEGLPLKPRTILLDLDDTIVDDSGTSPGCWLQACAAHRDAFAPLEPEIVDDAIRAVRRWYWADPERHRVGRLDLPAAREFVIGRALADLGVDDRGLAARISASYGSLRDRTLRLIDGAIDTVRWFRDEGRTLALVTNGAGPAQRTKIDRFGLAPLFDLILIEGEMGYGKPDPRVFQRALRTLGAAPEETCMIGDNLDWDVAPPQALGIRGIWVDGRGTGLPAGHTARPDRTIRTLSDLRHDL
jgi:putative hydrolase of the HAD superfamily